jgi:hypothetical protein
MRGRVYRLQLLLALASAVIFGSESRRTRGHILLTLFVASYDSLGHGGGIRPRLHRTTDNVQNTIIVSYWSLSLSLVLRPTVIRPVCLEIKYPSGVYDQIFIIV